MNPVAIDLGFLKITWYSLFILTGIFLAYIIIIKEARRKCVDTSFVSNLIFWCVIFGILGARIYYVIFNLNYYLAYPSEIIKIWNGGLAIHGGIIGGLICLIICCNKNNINKLLMLDISLPGVILAQAIGRWGNFFNSEAHGGAISKAFLKLLHLPKFVINGMNINGTYYHPTFLYESFFCLIGFVIMILFRRNKRLKEGNITSFYLIWYGLIRFFIESLRTDSLMLGNLKVAQIISVIMILSGIILLIIKRKKHQ